MAELSVGQTYRLEFVDVDGNTLSSSDGHVSLVVLTTRSNWPKAQAVGDQVPDFCIGDPAYRFITVADFGPHRAPVRALLTAGARLRLRAAARRAQPRYDEKKITRDPRRDIFAVADFDGKAVSQLGSASGTVPFRVFVFDRKGELMAQWNDVPSKEDLAAALRTGSISGHAWIDLLRPGIDPTLEIENIFKTAFSQ
jgi:hypothetical protein